MSQFDKRLIESIKDEILEMIDASDGICPTEVRRRLDGVRGEDNVTEACQQLIEHGKIMIDGAAVLVLGDAEGA